VSLRRATHAAPQPNPIRHPSTCPPPPRHHWSRSPTLPAWLARMAVVDSHGQIWRWQNEAQGDRQLPRCLSGGEVVVVAMGLLLGGSHPPSPLSWVKVVLLSSGRRPNWLLEGNPPRCRSIWSAMAWVSVIGG
jgi:hypothetical protein